MDYSLLSKATLNFYEKTSDNIIGVGFGYKTKGGQVTEQKSLIFTVRKKMNPDEIPEDEKIPPKVTFSGQSFTTDVVERTFQFLVDCPTDFYTWQSVTPTNRNKIRPLKGGISTTNYTKLSGYVGTMGFLAKDNETNSLVGVSNDHVYIYDSFINSDKNPSGSTSNVVNNVITQPNEGGNSGLQNAIGIVKRYNPLQITGYNYADVALTTINETDINYSTSYQQQGITGWTAPLEFATTAEIDNLLGNNSNLFSSGRTTGPKGEGEMKLKVFSSPVIISIDYNLQGVPTTVEFANCIEFIASATTTPNGYICAYPINGGDSGSALVADISGTRKIVGLVFAGSGVGGTVYYGFANRIDDVATAINISPWTGQSVSFSNTAATETYTTNSYSSTKNIILSGKTFWQGGQV